MRATYLSTDDYTATDDGWTHWFRVTGCADPDDNGTYGLHDGSRLIDWEGCPLDGNQLSREILAVLIAANNARTAQEA